jgi:hypothetical protein
MTEGGCQIVTAVGKAFIEIYTKRIKHLRKVNIIKSDFMKYFAVSAISLTWYDWILEQAMEGSKGAVPKIQVKYLVATAGNGLPEQQANILRMKN